MSHGLITISIPQSRCVSFDVYQGTCDCAGGKVKRIISRDAGEERRGWKEAWEPEMGKEGSKQLGAHSLGPGLPPALFQVRFLVQQLAVDRTQLSPPRLSSASLTGPGRGQV